MDLKTPKYLRVRDAILADIRKGALTPGDKLPTRNALMISHKVSRSTVEAALGELVRSGVLNTSKRGGTLVSDAFPSLHVAIVSNIDEEELKSERGEPNGVLALSRILTSSSKHNLSFIKSESIKDPSRLLAKYNAVVWLQPDDASLRKLERLGHKAIIVNRYSEKCSFVSTNHRSAVRELALYAFEKSGKGCQAFYLEHERYGRSFVQDERREGFIEACESRGIFYRICEATADHEMAVRSLARLHFEKDRKIAVISGTCIFSGAVLLTAEQKGLTLNKNFFYADFDNAHSLARLGRQMTTIIQDYSAMGKAVAKALDTVSKGEQAKIFVPYRLEKGCDIRSGPRNLHHRLR